jgi:hypothetical protein
MKNPNADLENSDSPDEQNETPQSDDSQESLSPSSGETLTDPCEAEFEEQEGEVLPLAEKKKSGAGKFFLLLVFILAGSGGYLYVNNLIPPEIIELVFPKPVSPRSPALITQIPPTPLPLDPVESEVVPAPVQSHLSGRPEIFIPPNPISEAEWYEETEGFSGTTNTAEPVHKPSDTQSLAVTPQIKVIAPQVEPITIIEPIEHLEPVVEPEKSTPEVSVTPSEPSVLKPVESAEPIIERDKSTQAYLDFIENSFLKLGGWIKQGFNWGWEYLEKIL